LKLLEKHPQIKYYIISSGLDDAIEERFHLIKEIKQKGYTILNLNNQLDVIRKSREIEYVFNILKKDGIRIPKTIPFRDASGIIEELEYPYVLKKRSGSGGVNIYKVNNKTDLTFTINLIKGETFHPKNWLMQEYIQGSAVSCTTISNGIESEIISINNQIIGDKYVNTPKEFMYCGNVVPANLFEEENSLISDISLKLSKELGLKGINGFDFVLKDNYPYLMEINPRIPGSIRASEEATSVNLLDLHVKSFTEDGWESVKKTLDKLRIENYVTKLIFFAPKEIDKSLVSKINNLDYVHDKSEPIKNIDKSEPVCTILYMAKLYSDSYLGALKVVDKIKRIIN
jgi:predicted ATP-grasp superfamily ATP-dependent carboligase